MPAAKRPRPSYVYSTGPVAQGRVRSNDLFAFPRNEAPPALDAEKFFVWNRGAAGLVAALGPRLKTTPCAHSLLGTVSVRNTHLFPLFCREDPLLLTEMWRVAGSWALKRRQLGWCAPSSAFVVPAVARISCAALIPRLVSLLLML